MDSWKRFKEESLPDKESFYSKLNKKGITDEDYAHAQKVITALLADVFESFRDKCLEIYELDPGHFLSAPELAWQACLKKTQVELELLTDNDMLLMFEEGIRGGMCQATHGYAKANNKYMNNHGKNEESSYIEYLEANDLYGWAMSQKVPVRNFKLTEKGNISKFNEAFIKNYDENSDKGYIFEVDVKYPETIGMLHSDLAFLPEKMKINKCTKLTCTIQNKENYIIHIRVLKQAINHGLKLKKVHNVIGFDQEAWLKPYIDMNTDLRKQAKNDFEKDFFKLINNSVFGKTMENVKNHRDIKIVTMDKRRSILASKPNCHSTKFISKDLLIMVTKKTEVKMNKPIYLGQAILDLSKTFMYEFWHDYIKPKYGDKARLCFMDTDSFVINIKTEDFYKDIANDVERWFDTSNYDKKGNRPLPIGKIKKVIGLFKDELGGKIVTEFCALRDKAYVYKLDDDTEHKKAKGTKKCIVKREIISENYKDSLFNDKVIIRSQQRFRSYNHKVYTDEVNKIALSSNDNNKHLIKLQRILKEQRCLKCVRMKCY